MRNRRYRGGRDENGRCKVEVLEARYWHPVNPRLDLWNHSPDGFEWGYLGSGPAQLALALLAHATSRGHLAVYLHQRFKADFVVKFRKDGWTICRHEILNWVLAQCENDLACPEQYTLTNGRDHA